MKFSHEIKIEQYTISEKSPVYIIAEAGVNHNGNMETARQLIDAAAEAGANAVKFQSFKSEKIVLKNTAKAPYQKNTTAENECQLDMLKALEVDKENMRMLQSYAKEKGITFLSTPFEKDSLEELCELKVPAIKVAATDITNIQYLREVAQTKKPIILSAGMCYMEEVYRALEAIYPYNDKVVLLQCSANYPIQDREANLNVIDTFKREFDIMVGYSDHSMGVGAAPYAVAKGAKVIEKHFTLDRTMAGPDQMASITPIELKQLVQEIKKVETYLGSGSKMPTCSEQFTRKALQKCLVAKKAIKKGERFCNENVVAKRTDGKGISALYIDDILERTAERCYAPDDLIEG